MNFPNQDIPLRLERAELNASIFTAGCQEQVLGEFFAAASAASVGIGIYDQHLRYAYLNEALAQMHGLPVEAHLGKQLRDMLPIDLWQRLEPLYQRVLETGALISNVEISGTTYAQPGVVRHWVTSCFPVSLEQQQGIGAIVLEVTARRHIEDALRASLMASTRDISGRKEAEAALQQRLERERVITKIALRIRQTLDLQDILNTAVAEVRQFLQADRVVINRCQAGDHWQTVAESVAISGPRYHNPSGPETWIESWLNLHPRADLAIEASNRLCSGPLLDRSPAGQPPQTRLAMPILLGNQLWGVLAADQSAATRSWEASEVELVEQLATQLAIAIQQSQLHQEIQRLNDDLESEVQARTFQLQVAYEFEATLKRITDRVRDSLDEDQILQAVVREVALVMKVSCCNASLYDLEQGTSTTCYEYTHSMSPYQGRISKFSTVPELYHQLSQGQYFQFCSLVPNPERGLVAMLACPILDDQGVIGDLWLIHHKQHAFSEQDIRLVQQVANQCAIAIRQARLYKAAQAQVRELERLNQLKDDFLSTVSHELRTPLSNMKMAIHMLRTVPIPSRRQRYLEILEAECSRETELINDLLDLQRLENACYAISLEPINLQEWLPRILAPFLSRAQNRQQAIEVDLATTIPALLSDRRSLERILAELLNNACKYTSPGGTILLQVHYEAHPSAAADALAPAARTTFTVSNQADIASAELPRMFEKFYRIPKSDPWQQGGTGLGLALVKKLVETLHGAIEAHSSNGWTTLKVQLPTLGSPKSDQT